MPKFLGTEPVKVRTVTFSTGAAGKGANSAAEGVHSWQTGGRINSWGKSCTLDEQHDLGPLRVGNLGGQMRLVDAAKKKKPPPFSESGFDLVCLFGELRS